MYADLGPGLEADISPPSPDGSNIFYSHEYVAERMRQRVANRPTGFIDPYPHGDLNPYGYAENSPVNATDPTGLATGIEEEIIILSTKSPGVFKVAAIPGTVLGVALYRVVTKPVVQPTLEMLTDKLYCRHDSYRCTTKARNWAVGTPCYGRIFEGLGHEYEEAKAAAQLACQAAGCHAPGRGGDCGHTTCELLP
jgi:hypothetical protein